MIALLLKSSLVITALLAFYKLFLEKESFFATNRAYLLACLVLTFILPFIRLPLMIQEQGIVASLIEKHIDNSSITTPENLAIETKEVQQTEQENKPTSPLITASNPTIPKNSALESEAASPKSEAAEKAQSFSLAGPTEKDLLYWLLMVYYFGLAVFTLNFLFQLANVLLKIFRSSDIIQDTDHSIINTPSMTEPCSFFHYIFINPESYEYEVYEQILAHEKIHVQKKHSLDLLLSEIAVILLWFNPFAWLFRKEVEKNMEYQTDDILLNGKQIEKEKYQMNLLKVAAYSMPLTITTNYNQSLLKQRIMKISAKKSNPHSLWKYAFVAPLLLSLLLLINKPSLVNAKEAKDALSVLNENSDTNIDARLPSEKNESDCKELLNAVRDDNAELVKTLLEKVDPNCIVHDPGNEVFIEGNTIWNILSAQTPLVAAGRNENLEIARLLVNKGADVNHHGASNETPLMAAAKHGDLEFVKFLVTMGAKVNILVEHWGSALSIASAYGHIEIVKYLKSEQAEIDARVPHVGTSLLEASQNGHIDVAKFLVANGANVNAHEAHVGTPLIAAAQSGHLETVKYLIAQGAKIDEEVAHIGTAILVAAQGGHFETVEYLASKGADVDKEVAHVGTPLLVAAEEGLMNIVLLLLTKKVDINKAVAHVGTPLSAAAEKGHLDVVSHLIANGADINKEVAHVGTPLLCAAESGQKNIVKLLIEKGADPNKWVMHVGSPLTVAKENGHEEIAAFLRSKGATQ